MVAGRKPTGNAAVRGETAMNEIRLKNFRCFRDKQTARLAPLTLLVGENSTGKTSFLAMIRVLWDVASGFRFPDFKEDPYDLGTFDEIAHYRGGRGGRSDTFEAGFHAALQDKRSKDGRFRNFNLEVTFSKRGTTPILTRRYISAEKNWIDECSEQGKSYVFRIGTARGAWELQDADDFSAEFGADRVPILPFIHFPRMATLRGDGEEMIFAPLSGSPDFGSEEQKLLLTLASFGFRFAGGRRPFASAPVRSKPRRTYDPSRPIPDPEGDYVPMYLANLYFQDREAWSNLKERLEDFGKAAGLFDEISVRPLGKRNSEPFQVQIRKFAGGLKGPRRNLIDVGYGVSQVLPIVTELLHDDAPEMFLLQQPEVHLHPSAQAALGSLFCQVASAGRQLVVETHSDHLMDRVRMDVRDGVSALKPEDVSILFFERQDLDVHIHSLRIDEEGNILDAPDGYRAFFMEETARSLWRR